MTEIISMNTKVRITISGWLAAREGIIVKEPYCAGTANVLRYTIRLPHKRTKTKTMDVSCQRHEFEIVR